MKPIRGKIGIKPIRDAVLLQPDTPDAEGGIILPDICKSLNRPTGILLAVGPRVKEQALQNGIGKRIIVRTCVRFEWAKKFFFHTHENQVLGIVENGKVVKLGAELERCQWCKSSGEGNMLMDHNGYCIQCGRNKYGVHKKYRQLKVTEEEIKRFGVTPKPGSSQCATTIPHSLQPEPEGKILSAASLKKRSRYL